MRLRIARRDRPRCGLHHEPDGDHQLRALIDEELQVRLVVLLRLAGEHQRRRDGQVRVRLAAQIRRQQRAVFLLCEALISARRVPEAGSHDLEPAQGAVVEGLIAAASDVQREAHRARDLLLPATEQREEAAAQRESFHRPALYQGCFTTRPPLITSETRSTADGFSRTFPGTAMTSAR